MMVTIDSAQIVTYAKYAELLSIGMQRSNSALTRDQSKTWQANPKPLPTP